MRGRCEKGNEGGLRFWSEPCVSRLVVSFFLFSVLVQKVVPLVRSFLRICHDTMLYRYVSLLYALYFFYASPWTDTTAHAIHSIVFSLFFFFCIVVADYHIRIYVAVEKKLCNTDMQAVQHVGGGWITLGVKTDIYNGTLQPVDGRGYTQIDT